MLMSGYANGNSFFIGITNFRGGCAIFNMPVEMVPVVTSRESTIDRINVNINRYVFVTSVDFLRFRLLNISADIPLRGTPLMMT